MCPCVGTLLTWQSVLLAGQDLWIIMISVVEQQDVRILEIMKI